MIAIPVSPPMRMVVVGSPAYLRQRGTPVAPVDLQQHRCINMRLPTAGGLLPWEFSRDGKVLKVRVEGQLTINALHHRIEAARAGMGLVYIPEDSVAREIATGELIRVLDEWCEPIPGYYLYYPSRRQHTTAFSLLCDCLNGSRLQRRHIDHKAIFHITFQQPVIGFINFIHADNFNI